VFAEEVGALDSTFLVGRLEALLDKFLRVIGIDWDRFAIAAAKENATEKEIFYIAVDVETELATTLQQTRMGDLQTPRRSQTAAP
jgi:hypothetical protein